MRTQTLRYRPTTGWSDRFADIDSESTLVLVFGARDLEREPGPIESLLAHYPSSRVIGCSTSGHFEDDALEDQGLVALIARFERASLRTAAAPVPDDDAAERAGRAIARELSDPDLRGLFVLSDGTNVNGTALTRGLREEIGDRVCISGGIAGDGTRFERTWVCCNEPPRPGLVAAVGFYGSGLDIWNGCRGGWETFGPTRRVTRASGNMLYELDGRPALDLYVDYLGDRASELPGASLLFPLAVLRDRGDHHLVRTVLGIDEANRAMRFAGEVAEGRIVQFMQASADRIIDGAAEAAGTIPCGRLAGRDSICIPISCVGRRMMLRHRAEDELEEVRMNLPACRHHVGFYSYGEICPFIDSTCELHNQSMTLTVIAEDAGVAA